MKKIKSSKLGSVVENIVDLMVLSFVKDSMITSSALTSPLFPPFTATVTVSPNKNDSLDGSNIFALISKSSHCQFCQPAT